jgi:pimeloyl-ACP methyl ester carboxylesterase
MAEFRTGSLKANGITFHFLEMGEGPLALCLHGFPDNAHTYRYLLPALARAGFRGVAPFMRGYAPTEAAKDGRYQSAHLSKDVLALIGALGAENAVLVGHDWGARAVYGAAVLEPEKVNKLVTIAAAHPASGDATNFYYLKGTWHAFYFQLPYAERTVAHNDYTFIEDWWRDASPEWDIPGEVLESVKETFRKPGVVEAALGYYRHSYNPELQDPALKDVQERINTGAVSVPTLALHGTRDRPLRLEAFQNMDHLFTGGLDKVIIQGTGHFMHQEKPQEVNSHILEFLKR